MKLSAPLRVTWDWNWPRVVQPGATAGSPGREKVELIAAELARAGVLMLEFGYPAAEDIRQGLLATAIGRAGGMASLALTPETIADLGEAELRNTLGPGEIWADVTPLEGKEMEQDALPRREDGSVWPDLRIYLTSANLEGAALLIAAALAEGVEKLSLPILPLFGSFLTSAGKQIPPWRDLVKFADRLDPLLKSHPDLDLRVHYQSLWTILRERGHRATDEEAPGHGGCQAASALAYIDPGGVLYPCASLPIPVGPVEEGTIARAWREDELKRLRDAIAVIPDPCGPCAEWKSCRGGCRGWAYYLTGRWQEAGPDCGRKISEEGSPR
jgi:GeoRSP system SPASM domain protein